MASPSKRLRHSSKTDDKSDGASSREEKRAKTDSQVSGNDGSSKDYAPNKDESDKQSDTVPNSSQTEGEDANVGGRTESDGTVQSDLDDVTKEVTGVDVDDAQISGFQHIVECGNNTFSLTFKQPNSWISSVTKILGLLLHAPECKSFTSSNNMVHPVRTHYIGRIAHEDLSIQRFVARTLNDGAQNAVNILTINPKTLTSTKNYLNVTGTLTVASIFFMTGMVTYSGLNVKKNPMAIYNVCVKPLDFAWNRICNNIAKGFEVDQLYVKSFLNGITFQTGSNRYEKKKAETTISLDSNQIDSNASAQTNDADFPVRSSGKVLIRDGRVPFGLDDLKNLPLLDQELEIDSPVLVTFTTKLGYWNPTTNEKELYKKFENGCTRTVYMNLQEVVLLDDIRKYANVSTLYKNEKTAVI